MGIRSVPADGFSLNVNGNTLVNGKFFAHNLYLGDHLKDCSDVADRASLSWDNINGRLSYCDGPSSKQVIVHKKDLEPLALKSEIGFRIDTKTGNAISNNTLSDLNRVIINVKRS